MKLDRDKLIRAREMLGYGVEKTAEEAGVSKNSVLRAEHEEDIRPVTARKIAAALEVEVRDLRTPGIEVSEAFFVPLEEGEEPDTVTLKPQYVWLFEGGEQILKAMRKASPEEAAAMRRQLENAGRSRE